MRNRIMSGGNPVARHEVLREDLTAFELSGGLRGTEDQLALGREKIDDSIDERRFRSDNGEIGTDLNRERQKILGLVRGRTDARRHFGATGIAGRDDNLLHRRAATETPCNCVLTSATAKYEDFH